MNKTLILLSAFLFARFALADADYIVIAPKNYVPLWNWYIGERAKVHPKISFAVKSAAEIYEEYPYGEGKDCRNAAESVKAYKDAMMPACVVSRMDFRPSEYVKKRMEASLPMKSLSAHAAVGRKKTRRRVDLAEEKW